MSAYKGQPFQLRIEPELYARAKELASQQGRSLNNFIGRAIEDAINGEGAARGAGLHGSIAAAIDRHVEDEVRLRLAKVAAALSEDAS